MPTRGGQAGTVVWFRALAGKESGISPAPACTPVKDARRKMNAAPRPLKHWADTEYAGLQTCGTAARPRLGTENSPSRCLIAFVATRVSHSNFNICGRRVKRKDGSGSKASTWSCPRGEADSRHGAGGVRLPDRIVNRILHLAIFPLLAEDGTCERNEAVRRAFAAGNPIRCGRIRMGRSILERLPTRGAAWNGASRLPGRLPHTRNDRGDSAPTSLRRQERATQSMLVTIQSRTVSMIPFDDQMEGARP